MPIYIYIYIYKYISKGFCTHGEKNSPNEIYQVNMKQKSKIAN